MQNGHNDYFSYVNEDKKKIRYKFILSILILLTVFMFSLCLRTDELSFIAPYDVFKNVGTSLHLLFAKVFKLSFYLEKENILYVLKNYNETMSNLNSVFITMTAGGILALSGAVYQNIFRNPLAAPTMLGVTSGINIGMLLLVLNFSSSAIIMQKERYLYSYFCGLGMVVIILTAGKLAGKSKSSVTDMLLIGVVISQLANLFLTYFEFNMTVENLEILQNFTMGRLSSITGTSLIVFVSITAAGILPIHLMRFSMNAVSFSDDDSYSMGINPAVMRITALLSATLLVTASIIHCGSIGIVSMIVPYICRYMFSSNFKTLYYSCILSGAVLLLICRDISNVLSAVLGYVPVSIFISLIGTPIFIFMLIKQSRGWE